MVISSILCVVFLYLSGCSFSQKSLPKETAITKTLKSIYDKEEEQSLAQSWLNVYEDVSQLNIGLDVMHDVYLHQYIKAVLLYEKEHCPTKRQNKERKEWILNELQKRENLRYIFQGVSTTEYVKKLLDADIFHEYEQYDPHYEMPFDDDGDFSDQQWVDLSMSVTKKECFCERFEKSPQIVESDQSRGSLKIILKDL